MKLKNLKNKLFNRSRNAALVMASVISLGILAMPLQARAAVVNATPAAKVSFTFDDGYNSALTQAAPTLAKYGYSGTDYVISGCVGMTTAPNTCHADNDKSYMTWDQINQLRSTYKWEIGSHTVTHPYLATSDPDDQPLPISQAQMIQEISQSKADFAAHGINTTAFASPYGDYNNAVLAQVAKNYTSQRGFADIGYNAWPNSDYLIREQQVQGGVSVATVKSYVDAAIQNKQWLVLVFHDIKTKASNRKDDYEYSTANLDQIAAYIKSKSVPVVNVSNGLVTSDTNLLPNASFNNGIADGWTTDSPSTIVKDTANNGSFPDSTNSIKFTSSTNPQHLFSPKVSVNSANSYVIKNFLNVKTNTSGEVNFYIDEYDANGAWISGQYKVAEKSSFVEELNFNYTPTSSKVAKASLQITVAGTGVTAYLDNVQWFATTNNVFVPPTNLMPNSNFDAGIGSGWTTNNATAFTADSANYGGPSDPVNSVKLTAQANNTSLFAPQISVDSTKTYNVGGWLNIKSINSGEVGYYIDEYDANGNWISGQYKASINKLGITASNFQYVPTSANVKKASLQIILVGNSGITGYFDSVIWTLGQ